MEQTVLLKVGFSIAEEWFLVAQFDIEVLFEIHLLFPPSYASNHNLQHNKKSSP